MQLPNYQIFLFAFSRNNSLTPLKRPYTLYLICLGRTLLLSLHIYCTPWEVVLDQHVLMSNNKFTIVHCCDVSSLRLKKCRTICTNGNCPWTKVATFGLSFELPCIIWFPKKNSSGSWQSFSLRNSCSHQEY